jgi:hypothetical protein
MRSYPIEDTERVDRLSEQLSVARDERKKAIEIANRLASKGIDIEHVVELECEVERLRKENAGLKKLLASMRKKLGEERAGAGALLKRLEDRLEEVTSAIEDALEA